MRLWARKALHDLHGQPAEVAEEDSDCDCQMNKESYYDIDNEKLEGELAAHVVRLQEDETTQQFLQTAEEPLWRHLLTSVLTLFLSYSYVNNLLGRGRLFVLSTEQFKKLVQPLRWTEKKDKSLLDIGAADGNVTEQLALLPFDKIVTTEVEGHFIRSLEQKQYIAINTTDIEDASILEHGPFDMVSCLNVIDRCDYPMKMIRDIFHVLRTDGICLLSVVLPLNDFVLDSRGQTRPAAEPLPQGIPRCGSHSDFESCVQTFYELVLQPVGLRIVALSRVPYLCQGDGFTSYYALPNALFLLQKEASIV